MHTAFLVIGWFTLSVVVSHAAELKGRSIGKVFWFSMFFSPLAGICLVAMLEEYPVKQCVTCKFHLRVDRFHENCDSCKGCEEAFDRGYM